ncbi:hypothetical protein MBEHAL_1013 [Halarchaeum acidiphilum MH1-52-1]|uniref:Uncharacterized protein n=1 Tax=Halarchaeum acidiphilum MH1-52-1 TaxID=1261545 RepID=U3ABU5_9EURY|nr:hypothetical protein [Halarchaeum acidiphilum]GAD52253.1 hypothetical protein MBEHAL_1013 [Halarchaeum acidiphilum MH1-52-1]
MSEDDAEGFVGRLARSAGRRYAETVTAYREGRTAGDLPRDDAGRVRIVCRRHAEKRAVALDEAGRPACYDADHPACEGCLEDLRDGQVESW